MVKKARSKGSAKIKRDRQRRRERSKSPEEKVTSSTTEIKKQIKKETRSTRRPMRQVREGGMMKRDAVLRSSVLCEKHGAALEFICKVATCSEILCGHCILDHTDHIKSIVSLKTIIQEASTELKSTMVSEGKLASRIEDLTKVQKKQLDDLRTELRATIDEELDHFQQILTKEGDTLSKSLQCLTVLKEKSYLLLEDHDEIDEGMIDLLRNFNQNRAKIMNPSHIQEGNSQPALVNLSDQMPTLAIDKTRLLHTLKGALEDFISYSSDGLSIETTQCGCPKLVHWFEWGKKRLNIYDIVHNVTTTVELDIPFKIPSFSRSIIVPSGHIYLIGGEEPEYFPRKEVYMFDPTLGDRKLHQRASMPHKKFDFTLCYLNGHIYVLCGKDSSSEVIETCERFNIAENAWSTIAPVKRKRYAASAVGTTNNRIYVFGGRTDHNNMMVPDIEEYNVETNTWEMVVIKGLNLWEPVEVCACLQISSDHILIFGGSDARIKDSNATCLFNFKEYTFEKKCDLKKPQVFVTAPFLYGKYVYAIGNEYYMKHRNLHRYSVARDEWEIIF